MPDFGFMKSYERFMRWSIPFQLTVLNNYATDIADGATVDIVAETECGNFSRITGSCKSNRAVTINVYQGSRTGSLDTKSSFTVAASATAGAGTGYSFEVVAKYFRVEAVNPAGAVTTTFHACCYLRSAS